MKRPRLAVFKFSSCDGCQLSVLSLEEDLLTLDGKVDIAYFPEASSRMLDGPYDIGLVEGSVSTPEDVHRLSAVREQCGLLISIGACATSGGIQALRNFSGLNVGGIYPNPEYIETLSTSTPISEHVDVDFELWGCPIDKHQLALALGDLLAGVKPRFTGSSVCIECKRKQQVCVLVARGEACLGPVTRTGCGAICPGIGRGCYGCFGPADAGFPPGRSQTNSDALAHHFHEALGMDAAEIVRQFRGIHAYLNPFKQTAAKWEDDG